MVRVLFNRKRIEVREVKEYFVKWGYHYTLYTDGKSYYITESDGSNEVAFFGNYENEVLAITDFEKYMVEFEKENSEEV